MPPSELYEVIITAPDPEWLYAFSRQLVEDGLCASAHNFVPVRSIYRWQGKIYERTEGRVSLHTSYSRVQEIVDRARERLHEAGVSAECTWGVGDPAQVIVDAAREYDASRIMIGAHHHGFFERLFGEDVGAEVQRAAECEVVLVE